MITTLLPPACLAGVSFSPESVANWTAEGDLVRFLSEGTLLKSSDNHYALSLFESGRKRFLQLAEEFRKNGLRDPDSMAKVKDEVPAFEEDVTFGQMAKHAVAFDGVFEAMLSDGAFVCRAAGMGRSGHSAGRKHDAGSRSPVDDFVRRRSRRSP